jgi:hypothetical protein
LPVQPDSENPNDVTELAAPIGENTQSDSLPTGTDMSPELGSNDMGDLGGDMGGTIDAGGMGDMGGGMPAEAEPIIKTPEEELLERSETRLLHELTSFLEKKVKTEFKDIKDLVNVQEKVKDIKWNTSLIKDINNHLIEDKGWNLENLENIIKTRFENLQDFFNVTMKEQKEKKEQTKKEKEESKNTADINNPQTQDLSGVDPNINSKRSNLMKQVVLKDGVLVPQESNSSKSALDNLTGAVRKAKASIKNLKEVKIKKAGIIALKASGKKFAEDFMGMGMDAEEPAKDDLAGAISELATAITDAMTVVEDLNVGMDAGELSDSENLFDSADETMGEGNELLADSDEEIADEAEEEGESFEEEKAEKDEEPAISEKEEEKEEDEKSATIMKKIIQKVAQIKKEAEGDAWTIGDPKDPKVKVNNNNITDIPVKDTKPTDKRLSNGQTLDKGETAAKGVTALGKGASDESVEKTASVEEIKIRKSVSAAVDKARLSVELAARQQLKGLIENPLKTAFVKNMEEFGVEKSAAEAIAHNAFLDGFEESQKAVIKEAFETFMEKSFDDFVKVAEFTKNYSVKFAEESEIVEPAQEEKEASLKGAPVKNESTDDMFTNYWGDVRKNYFK